MSEWKNQEGGEKERNEEIRQTWKCEGIQTDQQLLI